MRLHVLVIMSLAMVDCLLSSWSWAGKLATYEETVRNWDEERVSFWLQIYTRYDSTQTVVHDNRYPHILYEVLQFSTSGDMHIDKRSRIVQETVAKYQDIITRFDMGMAAFHEMSADEIRVYNLFKPIAEPDKFRNALSPERIRVQDGRRDQFIAGLRRSGRYMEEIKTILRTFGMPEQLVAMVFVESLFYPKAESKVGAAGLWQLMPKTASPLITVSDTIDERFDPYAATVAAAQILRQNYEILDGSWPLAITAYNHGLGGMLEAKKRHGGESLEKIIRDYKSGSFKFASRNFYAQYLAAVDALRNAERYFGPLTKDPPFNYDRLMVPTAMRFAKLAELAGVSPEELADLNPALTTAVQNGGRLVPSGYPLRVPAGRGTEMVLKLRGTPSSEGPPTAVTDTVLP